VAVHGRRRLLWCVLFKCVQCTSNLYLFSIKNEVCYFLKYHMEYVIFCKMSQTDAPRAGPPWRCPVIATLLFNLSLDKTLNRLSMPSKPIRDTRRDWLLLNGGALPFYWSKLNLHHSEIGHSSGASTASCLNKTMAHLHKWARPSSQFGNFLLLWCLNVQPFEHVTIDGCIGSTLRKKAMCCWSWFVSICATLDQN
jgi:hypothetical protein